MEIWQTRLPKYRKIIGHRDGRNRALTIVNMMKNKTNPIMEECRKQVTPEIKKQVDLCFAIANRVYSLLEERNMSQRDLARMLGKTETEVSRWLSGTHNLTIATIAKIATVLGDDIIMPTVSKPKAVEYEMIEEESPCLVAEEGA